MANIREIIGSYLFHGTSDQIHDEDVQRVVANSDTSVAIIICFTYQRPFQLLHFLNSIINYFGEEVEIHLLYRYHEETSDMYRKVFDIHANVNVHHEHSFWDDFIILLNSIKDIHGVNCKLIFCVDDMLFISGEYHARLTHPLDEGKDTEY